MQKRKMNNISIRNKDVDRLKNGEWLNDSLIDFWNQWISRNEGLDSMILFLRRILWKIKPNTDLNLLGHELQREI